MYIVHEVKNLGTITVISDDDPKGAVAYMSKELIKSRIRVLSQSAAKRRLLDINNVIKGDHQRVTVDGPQTLIKSDLVLRISYGYNRFDSGIRAPSVEIIDLSKDGEIIGGASIHGYRSVKVGGPALIRAIVKELRK